MEWRAVIGKGGMGAQTLAGMQECGRRLPARHRGRGSFYAKANPAVLGVELLEMGVPEAMWRLQVKDFLAIVTMDAHGHSLHAEVEKTTGGAARL